MERVLYAPRELPPLRPDVTADLPRYRAWLTEREQARASDRRETRGAPRLTVLMAVDGADAELLAASLAALGEQVGSSWRLAVAVVGTAAGAIETVLAGCEGRWGHDQFVRTHCAAGTPTGDALGAALAVDPDAEAFMVLGQHDLLAPDAVALLASALAGSGHREGAGEGTAGATLVYADEDRVDRCGLHDQPRLKPGWSPELLLATPYLGRPLAARRVLAARAGGLHALENGAWEHDLMLRLSEDAARIVHIPEVLYHRHLPTSGDVQNDAAPHDRRDGVGAVRAALARRGEDAVVQPGPLTDTWSVVRRPPPGTSVTIVIPFRDEPALLRTCVDSVLTTAGNLEPDLVLVDNGSSEPETRTLLERLTCHPRVRVLEDPRPFNWAALNNAAMKGVDSDVAVFLNNDIDARRPGWLEQLSADALRPGVGAVGARLLYPTNRVQHVGVVVGMGGAAGHVLAGLPSQEPGYLGMAVLTRDVSAVTGACLATRRAVFEELGGFDEQLGLDLNDIDYCLRAGAAGYRVVFEAGAELVHHESPSRGTSGSVDNIARFIERWNSLVRGGDPHLNPHLTRIDSSCALRDADEEGWWRSWRSSLETS